MTNYIDIDEGEAKQKLKDLEWSGTGKKPLFSHVMTGYMLAKAIWFFNLFIDKAIKCIDQSVIDMNADGTPTDNLEANQVKALLFDLKAHVYRSDEVIHSMLMNQAAGKGYGRFSSAIYKLLKIGVVRK